MVRAAAAWVSADLAQALGGGRQWRRARRRHGFLPSSLLCRSHGDGKGGRFEIGLKTEAAVQEEGGQRALEQQKGERLCTTTSPPSMARNSAAHAQSTAMRRPRPQAVRARGASPLPFRLPARPSLGAPWARGLLLAFWERGSPDLPARGLRRGSKGGPARPVFINTDPRPSGRAKPRGADDTELPQARPHQAGSRGGGEIKAGYLTRCP